MPTISISHPLPKLGAALSLKTLPQHLDWIMADHRDLELQDFHSAAVLEGNWKATALELKAMLAGHKGRLGVHGPFWGFKIDSQDPKIRAVMRERFLQCLEICAEMGATQMVIHSPYTTWQYNNFENTPDQRDDVITNCHLTLRDVVTQANSIGCELVIENIEDKDPASRVALAASFTQGGVHVSLDTGHAHYAYGSTGAPPVDYYVSIAGNALRHVHLQDADGYADRHWQPGEGSVNWRAVFNALAPLTSNPRLILEVRDQTRLMAGVNHLIDLGVAV